MRQHDGVPVAGRRGRAAGLALACVFSASLAAASCVAPESSYSVERADSLASVLRQAPAEAGDSADFARADSVCAGNRPVPAGDPNPDASAARVRAAVRRELERMGLSTCVRVISRTVQREAWLRHERITELLAWRVGQGPGLIYVPVRYHAPLHDDGEPGGAWIRPVATVLEAMRAFLADRPPGRGKPLVLSFTNAAEWFLEPAGVSAPDDSLAAGAAPIRGTDWSVGQLDRVTAEVSLPDETGPPATFPGPVAGLPGRPACETGARCEAVLPGVLAMHVHEVFSAGTDQRGARLAGERTLAVLRAADSVAVPYGTALPRDRAALPLWWLLPGSLLALAVACTLKAVLGPINAALSIARRARVWATWNRLRAGFWQRAWLVWLAYRPRLPRRADEEREPATGTAVAKLNGLTERANKAVRHWLEQQADGIERAQGDKWLNTSRDVKRWLEEMEKWEESRNDLLRDVADCLGSLRECVGRSRKEDAPPGAMCRKCEYAEDVADDATAVGRWESIVGCANVLDGKRSDVGTQVDEARDQAGELAREAGRLAKRARRCATAMGMRGPGSRSADDAARIDAANAAGRVGKELKATGAAVRRDAKVLGRRSAELSRETSRRLRRMEGQQYATVSRGLDLLIGDLRKLRREKEEYIANRFKTFSDVLMRFGARWWGIAATVAVAWFFLEIARRGQEAWTLAIVAILFLAAVVMVGVVSRQRGWRRNRVDGENRLGLFEVLACGIATAAVVVHGFSLEVNDPALNVVLSGVHEDVWLLVYVGVAAMVFLISALGKAGYEMDEGIEGRLSYWCPKARGRTADVPPPNVLRSLRGCSLCAAVAHVLLLSMVALVALDIESRIAGLSPPLDTLREPSGDPNWPFFASLLVTFLLPAPLVLANLPPVTVEGAPATDAEEDEGS